MYIYICILYRVCGYIYTVYIYIFMQWFSSTFNIFKIVLRSFTIFECIECFAKVSPFGCMPPFGKSRPDRQLEMVLCKRLTLVLWCAVQFCAKPSCFFLECENLRNANRNSKLSHLEVMTLAGLVHNKAARILLGGFPGLQFSLPMCTKWRNLHL